MTRRSEQDKLSVLSQVKEMTDGLSSMCGIHFYRVADVVVIVGIDSPACQPLSSSIQAAQRSRRSHLFLRSSSYAHCAVSSMLSPRPSRIDLEARFILQLKEKECVNMWSE